MGKTSPAEAVTADCDGGGRSRITATISLMPARRAIGMHAHQILCHSHALQNSTPRVRTLQSDKRLSIEFGIETNIYFGVEAHMRVAHCENNE